MSSRREREAERERDSRRAAASNRSNEYFVPGEGIDREVITADICRYLGNDALIRPGIFEERGQRIPGFFITAYRNLTSAMIADLRADSERWKMELINSQEKQNKNSQEKPQIDGYRDSTIHRSRQYYGPTEATSTAAAPAGGYPSSSAAGGVSQQEVYSQGYGSGQSYGQPNPGYGAQPAGYGAHQPDNYYIAGADYAVNQPPAVEPSPRGGRNGPLPPAQVPRGATGYPSQPAASYPESRGNPGGYYPPPNAQGQASSYSAHPDDAYYGRQSPAVAGYAEASGAYSDNRPYEQTQYSPGPSSTAATANQGAPRRGGGDRDPDPRDRHRSHGSSRPHGGRN